MCVSVSVSLSTANRCQTHAPRLRLQLRIWCPPHIPVASVVILDFRYFNLQLWWRSFEIRPCERPQREPAKATGAGHGHITEQSNWSLSDTRNEAVTPKRTHIKTHMELVYRNCKWMRLKVVFKQRKVVKLSSISAYHTLRISDMWIAWITHESVIDIVYVVYSFAHMNTDELQDICTASTLEWSALGVIYVLAVKRFPFIVLEWIQPHHRLPLSHATCAK